MSSTERTRQYFAALAEVAKAASDFVDAVDDDGDIAFNWTQLTDALDHLNKADFILKGKQC